MRNWQQPTPKWEEFDELYRDEYEGRISIRGKAMSDTIRNFFIDASKSYPGVEFEMFAMRAETFRNLDPANSGTYQHTDPHDVVHWQCRGASEWFMGEDQESVLLEPGDLIWFKANTKHRIENLTEKYALIFNAGKLS